MAQGVLVGFNRAPTKKALREAVATRPKSVYIEQTSIVGREYDGGLENAPPGVYYIVGPCPFTERKWYANITVSVRKGERVYRVK